MSSSLNIQLTNELRRFIDARSSDDDVYSTPSEYIRDLVRRDMERMHKLQEIEIATALMEARKTPITPMDIDFIGIEGSLLKNRSAARKNNT